MDRKRHSYCFLKQKSKSTFANNSLLLYLLVISYACLSNHVIEGRRSRGGNGNQCPEECFCNTVSKIVYCSRKGLSVFPQNLPPDSRQLNLNGNQFEVPVLQKSNLTHATGLEHLYLSECGIEKIKVGTFEDMRILEWLDISKNRITRIDDFTFRGLSLAHLFLNGNTNLDLSPKAFRDMSTTGLYLHECSLSKLQYEVFRPLNGTLEYLWLNGNALETISKRFIALFSTLSHLRLGANPIHCNCESMWLKEFYDSSESIFQGSEAPSCLSPAVMRGKHFSDIKLTDFKCVPPIFKNIDVVLENHHKMLRCSASGDPAPTLYWISPKRYISIKYEPTVENLNAKENTAVLNISATAGLINDNDISGQYFCLAINNAGNMTFTFNVSWPNGNNNVLLDSDSNKDPTNSDLDNDYYYSELGDVNSNTEDSVNNYNNKKGRTAIPPFKTRAKTNQMDRNDNNFYKPTTPSTDGIKHTKNRMSSHQSTFNSIYIQNNNHHSNNNNNAAASDNVINNQQQDSDSAANRITTSQLNDHQGTGVHQGSGPSEHMFTLLELIAAIVGTFICTIVLCLLIMPFCFKRIYKYWHKRRKNSAFSNSSNSTHSPSRSSVSNSLEKPPLILKGHDHAYQTVGGGGNGSCSGDSAVYLPPVVTMGNPYEGRLSKTYKDYYFEIPSPIKR